MKNFERELGYLDTADGVAAPYSPAWLEAALDCNDRPGTHRRLRAARRTGSTRIRVSLVSTYDCGGGPAYTIDEPDAFGRRAVFETLGCFIQDLVEDANDLVDPLGRQTRLVATPWQFGQFGTEG